MRYNSTLKNKLMFVLANKRARKFYEKCGFEKTEDFLDDTIDGRVIRDIRYVRRL